MKRCTQMQIVSFLVCVIGLVASPVGAANVTWVTLNEMETASAAAAGAGYTESPDIGYTNLLKGLGHNVTRFFTHEPLTVGEISQLNASDLVIIGRAVNSGEYEPSADWNTQVTAPVMVMSGYTLRPSRLNLSDGETMVDIAGPTRLLAHAPSHPIFDGVSLNGSNETVNPILDVVTDFLGTHRGASINMANVVGGNVLASVTSDGGGTAGGFVIAEWETGAAVNNGEILAGPRMTFLSGSREISGQPVATAGIFDLSQDGQQLFVNAVNYLSGETATLIPGDADGNGTVELLDFEIIRDNFNMSVTSRSLGDLTFDGIVDFDDFRQWKDNFPGANGAVGAAASVPEPASMVLVFLTLPWILRRRK
ncbi:MAG: hypothetical protein R3E01_05880 [Pirellulaceae bacterium]|nr:hypothetical protein [Planctomycetales bacterium]